MKSSCWDLKAAFWICIYIWRILHFKWMGLRIQQFTEYGSSADPDPLLVKKLKKKMLMIFIWCQNYTPGYGSRSLTLVESNISLPAGTYLPAQHNARGSAQERQDHRRAGQGNTAQAPRSRHRHCRLRLGRPSRFRYRSGHQIIMDFWTRVSDPNSCFTDPD